MFGVQMWLRALSSHFNIKNTHSKIQLTGSKIIHHVNCNSPSVTHTSKSQWLILKIENIFLCALQPTLHTYQFTWTRVLAHIHHLCTTEYKIYTNMCIGIFAFWRLLSYYEILLKPQTILFKYNRNVPLVWKSQKPILICVLLFKVFSPKERSICLYLAALVKLSINKNNKIRK